MPENNPKEFIKFNSHLSYIQEQERNNPNIHRYTEFLGYDYAYYAEISRRAIPIALIVCSEEEKYTFQYLDGRNMYSNHHNGGRNATPRFIFVYLQELDDYRCCSRFGLIRLGKLGSNLNNAKCVKLKMMELVNGDMVRRDDIYYDGEPVISIQECDSNTCLELLLCDYYGVTKMKIELCQEDIENTCVHSVHFSDTNLSDMIPYRSYENASFESTLFSPQINTTRVNILFNSKKRIYNSIGYSAPICLFQYEKDNQKVVETIDATDYVSGQSILMVNRNSDELFIMNFGRKRHGFYKVIPSKKMELSDLMVPSQIDQVPFENYAEYKPSYDDEKHSIVSCPLTATKYLVLISKIKEQQTSFQGVFTKRSTWLLIDLQERRVKTVYPRVYDLASLTKQSDDEFVIVKKRVRRGKIGNDCTFPDGDLNGGYSDIALLRAIKPSNVHSTSDLKDFTTGSSLSTTETIDQKPTSLIPFPVMCKLSDSKLISFRPFTENPELFQVHLFCPENVTIIDYLLTEVPPVNTYGHTFRFYFKFRDEATCKYAKLLKLAKQGQYSDISIKTVH